MTNTNTNNTSVNAPNSDTALVFVPGFPGFYHSAYAEHIDHAIEQVAMDYLDRCRGRLVSDSVETWDVVDIVLRHTDTGKMRSIIAETHARMFELALTEHTASLPVKPWAKTDERYVTYKDIVSPKEYNFETDRLRVLMPRAALTKLWESLDRVEFAIAVQRRHSHQSGFVSFYPSDITHSQWEDFPRFDANQYETMLTAAIVQGGKTLPEHRLPKEQEDRMTAKDWQAHHENILHAFYEDVEQRTTEFVERFDRLNGGFDHNTIEDELDNLIKESK